MIVVLLGGFASPRLASRFLFFPLLNASCFSFVLCCVTPYAARVILLHVLTSPAIHMSNPMHSNQDDSTSLAWILDVQIQYLPEGLGHVRTTRTCDVIR